MSIINIFHNQLSDLEVQLACKNTLLSIAGPQGQHVSASGPQGGSQAGVAVCKTHSQVCEISSRQHEGTLGSFNTTPQGGHTPPYQAGTAGSDPPSAHCRL